MKRLLLHMDRPPSASILSLFVVSIFLTLISLAPADDIFVAPQGNDGASGRAEAPLRTIQAGLNLAKAGDTVIVKSGVYRERVVFPSDGEADRPITLLGEEGATIDAGTLLTGWQKVERLGGNIYRVPIEGPVPMNLTLDNYYELRLRNEFMAEDSLTTLRDGPLGWDDYEGEPYRGWNGVGVMWGTLDRFLYLGFGNRDADPVNHEITITPDGKRGGAGLLINNRKHLVVSGLTIRNGYHAIMIRNESTDCLITNNTLIGGKHTVAIAGGSEGLPSRIVVTKNRCTLGYAHTLDPGDPRHWFIWAAFKKNSDWDRTCIDLKDVGTDIEISENHLFENFNGVANSGSSKRLVVRHNLIELMADDGLEPNGEESEAHWHHNTVRFCNIQYRHKNIYGEGPMYVYNNWFYSRPGQKNGSNRGIYFFGGTTTPAFIYHNTFVTSEGMAIGSTNIQSGLANVWLINNLFSCDDVMARDQRQKVSPRFDYNYFGSRLSSTVDWWGENNRFIQNGQLWDLRKIPEGQARSDSPVCEFGIDLSKEWTIGESTFPALPGIYSNYLSDSSARVGALVD